MMWFIIWMLLTADEPVRDGGMDDEEREYIMSSLTSQSQHQRFNVQQVIVLFSQSLSFTHPL